MPKKTKGKTKKKGKKSKGSAKASIIDFYKPPPLTKQEILYEAVRKVRWWCGEETVTISRYLEKWSRDTMTTNDFIAALRYLQAPVTYEQIDMLLKYLDPQVKGIVKIKDFLELSSCNDRDLLRISHTTPLTVAMVTTANDDAVEVEGKKGKKKKKKVTEDSKVEVRDPGRGLPCGVCGVTVVEPIERYIKYVELQLTLATFKDTAKHPGHFTVTLSDSTTIHGVSGLITNHWNKAITNVAIFTEPSCDKDTYLKPSWSLESCGITGNTVIYEPTRYQLYYDYMPDIMDCPLLMADTVLRYIPVKPLKINI